MRLLALAAALSMVTVPAFAAAQDAEAVPEAPTSLAPAIDKMADPEFQGQMAGMLEALGEVMMSMPIGPLAEAAERASGKPIDIDRDATVRDLAGPDAEDMPAKMAERVPEMMNAASGMARGLEAMLPMLRAWADEMEASVKHARDRNG